MLQKRTFFFIAIFIIILAIVIFVFTRSPSLKTALLYKASTTINNVQFPYLVDSHTINFYSGSSFVSYDFNTSKTTNISPEFIMPSSVTTMRWSSKGVIFQASGYSTADDLYQVLVNRLQLVDRTYWWNYDYKSGQLGLIEATNPSDIVKDAVWNNNGDGYAYLTDSNAVFMSAQPKTAIFNVSPGSSLIHYDGRSLIIKDRYGLETIDTTTHSETAILKQSLQESYVSPDGNTIAYTTLPATKAYGNIYGDLYLYSTSSHSSKKIHSSFSGTISGNSGNLYVAYADSKTGIKIEYYPLHGQPTSYDLEAILDRDSSFSDIIPLSSDAFYVVSSKNTLKKATTIPTNILNPVDNTYLIDGDYYFDGFEVHYLPDKNSYEIDISKNPFLTYQSRALDYIRSKNIDPNQINIIWRANDGIDKTNPAIIDGTTNPGFTNE